MKIVVHITHYYQDSRTIYLDQVINGIKTINEEIDIFIHTNVPIKQNANIVIHNLRNENPYYLTWKHRPLILSQKNMYDVYMYLEDDILFTDINFEYWKKYHSICNNNGWYLGFLRKELNQNGEWVSTDVIKHLNDKINLNNITFTNNNNNVYSGFWIADKNEFSEFSQKSCFDLKTKPFGYDYREAAAIGLIPTFKGSLVLNEPGCFVHHLPNNYAINKNSLFGKIRCNEVC